MAAKKYAFALYGKANVGKSNTLKKLFVLLTEAYPNAPVEYIHGSQINITVIIDITVIIEIDGIRVGIESQGDPSSRLPESIERFKKDKCSIIICATRTRGGTVTTVEKLQPEFTLDWIPKTSEPQPHLQPQHDNAVAQIIFTKLHNALAVLASDQIQPAHR